MWRKERKERTDGPVGAAGLAGANGVAGVPRLMNGRAHRSGMPRHFALLAVLLLIAPVACSPAPGPTRASPPGVPMTQATATPAPVRIYVAIGASDAFGIGTDDPRKQAWPVALARTLGDSFRLINLSIPGATVDLATRVELPVALDTQPAVVTVWLAVNDFDAGVTLDTYRGQLRALLHALVAATHALVYVANLPDLTLLPYFAHRDPGALQSAVSAWNAAIAAVCADEGAVLVDLYATWTELAMHPEYISVDGFHPSALGAARLAALFAAAIVPNIVGASRPSSLPSQLVQAGFRRARHE
jgi:acyl-CoA thioesterase-1